MLPGAVAFNGPGSFPGAPTLRSVLGDAGPGTASEWPGAVDFDTGSGAFAAADRLLYVGSNGHRRVAVATAAGPTSTWRRVLRGPSTGGAHVAAAASGSRSAAVFGTFERGGLGHVYLVRQTGASWRVSARGRIRSVSVGVNRAGDVLVAWDRSGTIEARFWYAGSRRLSPVSRLGRVNAAAHLSVALGSGRRAIVAWVDQRVSEGNTGQRATVMATARRADTGFLPKARVLERFPDTAIPGGVGVASAFTSDGRGVVAWSGAAAVRASLVSGRAFGAAQDLAAAPAGGGFGLSGVAVSSAGKAAVTLVAPVTGDSNQVLVAPLAAGADTFAPAEAVSEPVPFLLRASAAFDRSDRLVAAWANVPARTVELAVRQSPPTAFGGQ